MLIQWYSTVRLLRPLVLATVGFFQCSVLPQDWMLLFFYKCKFYHYRSIFRFQNQRNHETNSIFCMKLSTKIKFIVPPSPSTPNQAKTPSIIYGWKAYTISEKMYISEFRNWSLGAGNYPQPPPPYEKLAKNSQKCGGVKPVYTPQKWRKHIFS